VRWTICCKHLHFGEGRCIALKETDWDQKAMLEVIGLDERDQVDE
jgi:hypothetical protein